MSNFTIPAPNAPPVEWGCLAVSIPGWRLLPGMRTIDLSGQAARVVGPSGFATLEGVSVRTCRLMQCSPIDPDDPGTTGCLLALAGAPHRLLPTVEAWLSGKPVEGITSLGRAVIVDVRDQWGRWPGGEG